MEYKFIKENLTTVNWNKIKPYRYMDDLLIIYDKTQTLDFLDNMYDNSLTLEKTSKTDTETEFLDIYIRFQENKIETNIYNKTDYYQFKVNRYVHGDSNIHPNVITGTLIGEIIRTQRICSEFSDFCNAYNRIILHFEKNSCNKQDLIKQASKYLINNTHLFRKYNIKVSSMRDINIKLIDESGTH